MPKTSNAWAWWDEEDQDFTMVYPDEDIVRICSIDGFKDAEKRGKGQVLPVTITERLEDN